MDVIPCGKNRGPVTVSIQTPRAALCSSIDFLNFRTLKSSPEIIRMSCKKIIIGRSRVVEPKEIRMETIKIRV